MPKSCFHCGKEIEENNFGRQDSCLSCGRDTKVCKNCINYDPKMHNECKENQAERIVDKEKRNFCDWFKPGAQHIRKLPGTI